MIIGSMKCGTSSLYSHLVNHPEICPCSTKEPNYFCVRFSKPEYKPASYGDLFPLDTNIHRFALEASTGYTKYPSEEGVPERIKASGLTPKFIYLVRDPFERIRSHYNFMLGLTTKKFKITDAHLIHTTRYNLQLEQYRAHFPKEDILVLDFDDLKRDAAGTCQRVFDFIGATKLHLDIPYKIQNRTEVQHPLRGRVEALVSPLRRSGIPGMDRLLDGTLRRLLPNEQRQLNASERSMIHEALEEDMLLLAENYGIDVAKWGFHPTK